MKLCNRYLQLIIVSALHLSIVACGSSSTSPDSMDEESMDGSNLDTTGGPNLYSNNFMLSRATESGEHFGDSYTTTHDYSYDFETNEITILETTIESDETTNQAFNTVLDDSGRIISGTFPGVLASEVTFNVAYDVDGLVKSAELSEGSLFATGIFTYNYLDGILDSITQATEDATVVQQFSYDENRNRSESVVTVADGDGNFFRIEYTYGANSVLDSAKLYNIFGRNIRDAKFFYDQNGNLERYEDYLEGNLSSTTEYDYIESTEPVFNHNLMRIAIDPLYPTDFYNFVR